jgi:hypothetical protein
VIFIIVNKNIFIRNHKGIKNMNLEKIIAENMLRFGVKNLDQLQIENVIRLTELKDPPVEGTPKQFDAGKPTAYWKWSVTCYWVGMGTSKCYVSGACTSKDGQTGWKPANIYIRFDTTGVNYTYDAADGTFKLSTNATEPAWETLNYSGPGNIPVNALTAVLAAINKKCNASTKASADLSTGISSMQNHYVRSGTHIDGKFPCQGKWMKKQLSNPETDAAIGAPYLSVLSNTTMVNLNDDGTVTKNSKVSYSYAGAERTIGSTVANLAGSLVSESTPKEVPGFASGLTGKDKFTIADQLVVELGRIANASTITAPAPVDKK